MSEQAVVPSLGEHALHLPHLFDISIAQDSLEASQRQAALWGQIAVHASFGDVELAQMSLRGRLLDALFSGTMIPSRVLRIACQAANSKRP